MKRRFYFGLTIGESLVSLSLLSLVMVGVLNLFPSTLSVIGGSRIRAQANSAAQDRLEQMASEPFANLTIGSQTSEEVEVSDKVKVKLTKSVAAAPGHDPKFLKSLECRAEWSSRGAPQSVTRGLYVHSLRR